MRSSVWILAVLALAACQQKPATPPAEVVAAPAQPAERTAVSEAPFTATSAQGAADLVQTYFALLEEKRYDQAWKLWADGGQAGARSIQDFTAHFDVYDDYHAEIGAPGPIEGAAGSLYVDVPVTAYGRLRSGGDFRRPGTVTLRRVNDVPGSSAEQRQWRIARTDIQPEV